MNNFKKVKAVKDESSHWYIIPNDLADAFYRDLQNDSLIDSGQFDYKYRKYRTGGDLNLVQLYIEGGLNESRPVGDVEGYLDSTPVYIMSNETKQFVNGQGYVTFEDALAAITEALEASYNVKEADRKVFQQLKTRITELEEENRKLRETLNDDLFKKLHQSLKDNLK